MRTKSTNTRLTAEQFQRMLDDELSEHDIQCRCVDWFRLVYKEPDYIIAAIPNGGKRNIAVARKMKREGVLKGFADLIVLKQSKGKGALFIEMKTRKGVQQQSQKEFEKYCNKNGYAYVVCRSEFDFKQTIKSYLGDK